MGVNMPSAMRARIVAIVSSEEQATDDRSSLPLQIERSREVVQHRGWVEVAPPIQIWQSRDFYSLDALRDASPEYNELCIQAERGELDIVVGRDHSRVLGRTEALQAALRSYLSLCRVQLYFYTAPIEPTDPTKLGRRGRGQIGAAYLHAISAVRDEEEVARFVQRREDGMNNHAERGRWKLSKIPAGYIRRTLAVVEDRAVLGDLEVEPAEATLIRKMFDLYWDGKSLRECQAWYWEARGLPPEKPGRYAISAAHRILTNPVYVGVMVYGTSRADVATADGITQKVRQKRLQSERSVDLVLEWLNGHDARTPEEVAAGIIIAWGQWEPIVDRDIWIAVQGERRRRTSREVYKGDDRPVHPLSGLLHCGTCGSRWAIESHICTYRNNVRKASEIIDRRPVYRCTGVDENRQRCKELGRAEHHLQADLLQVLARYTWESGLLERALARVPSIVKANEAEVEQLEQQIRSAEGAMAQWDAAFEAQLISMEEWCGRVAPHRAKKEAALAALKHTQAREEKQEEPERQVARIRELLAKLAEIGSEAAPRDLKKVLRQLIHKVLVKNKRIVHILFN